MRRWARRVALAALLLAGILGTTAAVFVCLPLPEDLLTRQGVVSLRFTDRTGGVLRELRSREDGRSVPLPGPVPPQVRESFLAAEDKRFDSHPGIDPLAIARAVKQNLLAGRVVSGASTLPAQLARRLRPRERTLIGKTGEALWALRLCAHLPREQVLREYLDRVPLGNSVYGVEAAAQLYFGRPAASLSQGQAALLAGMARSPARYDPYRHPERARARMRQVLELSVRAGFIDAEEAELAAEVPLDLVPPEKAFRAPHLTVALERALPTLGLDGASQIQTTLDPALQRDVEAIVREVIGGLTDKRVGQGAAVVLDNATGEVLAYVGSVDFFDEVRGGQNDGVRSARQPGSALKPFAYGLALATGHTPATVLSDVETHLATPSGDYAPRNYDRRVHGPVRLRAALANSYNVPAVRLAEKLGPGRVLSLLRRAGFDSLDRDAGHYGVGIVLGNGDVTLRELARAYRGLALGGMLRPVTEIRSASDAHGAPLPVPREREPVRFLPEDAVALLTDILSDEPSRAPAFGLENALRLPFPVVAKTGTSRAHIDNWTAGFTRERTVAVWVGNFEGNPMRGVSGITGAAPLFRRVMIRAMAGITPAPLVDRSRFERAPVCTLSGERAGSACPSTFDEVFLPGTAPTKPCPMHRLNADGRRVLDVGAEFYAWARGEGLEAGPWSEPPSESAEPGRIRLLLPGEGDEYLLEPGIPLEDQTIPLRVVAPDGTRRLELRIDGVQRVELGPPFSTRLALKQGRHRVEVFLPGVAGATAGATFVVR